MYDGSGNDLALGRDEEEDLAVDELVGRQFGRREFSVDGGEDVLDLLGVARDQRLSQNTH